MQGADKVGIHLIKLKCADLSGRELDFSGNILFGTRYRFPAARFSLEEISKSNISIKRAVLVLPTTAKKFDGFLNLEVYNIHSSPIIGSFTMSDSGYGRTASANQASISNRDQDLWIRYTGNNLIFSYSAMLYNKEMLVDVWRNSNRFIPMAMPSHTTVDFVDITDFVRSELAHDQSITVYFSTRDKGRFRFSEDPYLLIDYD
jgi:hypothetical protein